MARSAKPVAVSSRHNTSREKHLRAEIEARIRGDGLPECPEWLTEDQRELFGTVSGYCAAAGILSQLDGPALAQFCIAVDRLRTIERMVNEDPAYLVDSHLMKARKSYERTLWRGCSAFCLDLHAKAKMESLAAGAEHDAADPLAVILTASNRAK